jgi:hypothetical protein
MRGRLLFGAGLIAVTFTIGLRPSAAAAQNEANNESKEIKLGTAVPQRVYDPEHHDYHVWDANEQRAYHRFWEVQHRKYRDYSKLNAREVSHYWTWRHGHLGRVADHRE